MRPFGDPRNRDNVERQGTHARVEEAIARLQSLIAVVDERTVWQTAAPSAQEPALPGRHVFVVHGHNAEVKQDVARTLERLDLEPVISSRAAGQGPSVVNSWDITNGGLLSLHRCTVALPSE